MRLQPADWEAVEGGTPAAPSPARVLIVAEEEARVLRPLIDRSGDMVVTGVVRSSAWAINAARGMAPDVVMVCLEPAAGLEVAARLMGELGSVPILAMSASTEAEYQAEAGSVGASYLARPFTDQDLLAALRTLARPGAAPAANGSVAPSVLPAPPGGNGEKESGSRPFDLPAAGAAGFSADATGGGRVTVVLGAKGGVGKTTIAIALAHALDQTCSGRVGIVDLDLQFGDVALMLGVSPLRGMSDISREIARRDGKITAAAVESMMPDYHGICLVCGPASPDYTSITSANDIAVLIGALRGTFDHVVVDSSTFLGDPVLRAVDLADRIFLVTDLSAGALQGAQLCLNVLRKCAVGGDRISVVVNRVEEESSSALDDLEGQLGAPIEVILPRRDDLASAALEKRVPISVPDPQALLSQGITRLAASVQGMPARTRAHAR